MTFRSTARSVVVLAVTAMTAVVLAGCAAGTTPLPLPSAPTASTHSVAEPVRSPSPSAIAASTPRPAAAPTPASTPRRSTANGTMANGTTANGTTASGTVAGVGTAGGTAAGSGVTATSTASRTAATPPVGTGSGTRSGPCTHDHLSASIGNQDGQSYDVDFTMQHENVSVLVQNTGSTACTVRGWPGVSYVGHDGAQIGGAATSVQDVPHPTVTLQPGGTAQAHLTAVSPGSRADAGGCSPAPVDGMRVDLPGVTRSFSIEDVAETTGGVCAEPWVSLLEVEALIPNP